MQKDIHTEITTYTCEGITFNGFLAAPTADQKLPGVLVVHDWKGQRDFARKKAISLAELGYVAFAVDLYGNGMTAETDEEAKALMTPLFIDRALLQKRMIAGYDVLKNNSLVDPDNIAAIGFCFGGLAVFELLRSGTSVKGVVSFHGVLTDKLGELQAVTTPLASSIKAKLLILHGNDDPMMSKETIIALQNQMTNAHIDWQMVIYGHTTHAFTNSEVYDFKSGLSYNADADRRSWQSMRNFFEEIFK